MTIDSTKAPLFDKLRAHYKRNAASFHVPGHKSGEGLSADAEAFFKPVMSIDLTEISGLDDLHHPTGAILEAQRLAADCFGADETYFLVNGSTVGNLALILSTCEKDDILIVQRNVHKSILHGLMLAGARAVFLPPRWDRITGAAAGIRAEDVEKALNKYPEAKAVMVSNPNYYGMSTDLEPIAETAHRHGKPLLVDEAHGAHFGFHPDVPPSALSCGADGVVQSTHKMLTAMTMGSMLHIQGPYLDKGLIKRLLTMLQSSSPSYPIMASLDLSRRWMHTIGKQSLSESMDLLQSFKSKLAVGMPWFEWEPDGEVTDAYEYCDPFKMMVRDRTGTFNGFQLQEALERQGCICEMADAHYAVLFFSLATKEDDLIRLYDAFQQITSDGELKKKELCGGTTNIHTIPPFSLVSPPISFHLDRMSQAGVSPQARVRTVRLPDAVGSTAAEMVIPYPPGIPILYPGECITPEAVDYLHTLSEAGARFQGVQEERLRSIQVYC